MITIIIIAIALAVITIIGLFFLGAGSISVLLIFGDVIIGGLIVYWIIKAILKNKKNED